MSRIVVFNVALLTLLDRIMSAIWADLAVRKVPVLTAH